MVDDSTSKTHAMRAEDIPRDLTARYCAHEFLLEYLYLAAFAQIPLESAGAEVERLLSLSRGIYGADAANAAEDIEYRRIAARVQFNIEGFANRVLARRAALPRKTNG